MTTVGRTIFGIMVTTDVHGVKRALRPVGASVQSWTILEDIEGIVAEALKDIPEGDNNTLYIAVTIKEGKQS